MRIAFIGADSTGKTTLIDEISQACSHMNILTIKNIKYLLVLFNLSLAFS